MPIVDVELVCARDTDLAEVSASRIATALGKVFGSAPGRVWVRLRSLPASHYAENDAEVPIDELPVFVTVLHAHPLEGEARIAEIAKVTGAVAACVNRPPERVHVQYAPAAAGRQAFGGNLVR